MKPTYFQGNSVHPQHISVGAVLVSERGEVRVHHFNFKEGDVGYWPEVGVNDFYILMRETIEPGESLEEAVYRGVLEEFGAEAEIVDFIGSIESHFEHKGVDVQKTTLYFLCRFISEDLSKRGSGDVEDRSTLEWKRAGDLVPLMKAQGKKFGREDLDESAILERAIAQGRIEA